MTTVTGLRSAIIQTNAYEQAVKFYSNTWGLDQVPGGDVDQTFLRGTGADNYIFSVCRGDAVGLSRIALALPNREAVDNITGSLKSSGVIIKSPPKELTTPGGGYGVTILDPDGREIELSANVARLEPIQNRPFAPIRLGHTVLNTPQIDTVAKFFTTELGFEISDYYENNILVFLSCNEAHHCIALANSDNVSIHHMAFDVADIDALMRNVGRMASLGHDPIWGPGRHGPGGNAFSYYADPSGVAVEYTTGLIQSKDRQWRPKEWKRTPETADIWGTSGGPNPESMRVMSGATQH